MQEETGECDLNPAGNTGAAPEVMWHLILGVGPHFRVSGWNLRMSISNKFPSDAVEPISRVQGWEKGLDPENHKTGS